MGHPFIVEELRARYLTISYPRRKLNKFLADEGCSGSLVAGWLAARYTGPPTDLPTDPE